MQHDRLPQAPATPALVPWWLILSDCEPRQTLPTQVAFVKWFVISFREEKNTLTQGERSQSLQETGLCVLQAGATDGYRQLLTRPD